MDQKLIGMAFLAARTANRRRDSLPGRNSDPVAEAAVAGLKQVAATGEKP
jgi:hypothetical protein